MTSLKMRWRGLMVLAVLLVVAGPRLRRLRRGRRGRPTTPTRARPSRRRRLQLLPWPRTPSRSTPSACRRARAGRSPTTGLRGPRALTSMDESGGMQAVPKIAESWEPNEDATVWTFTLKKGVMFQAPVSREVMAQDFVDSWNRATDPADGATGPPTSSPRSRARDDAGKWTGKTASRASRRSTTTRSRSRCATRSPSSRRPSATRSPRSSRSTTSTRSAPRTTTASRSAPGRSWSRSGRTTSTSTSCKNPDYWDTENAGYLDAIDMQDHPRDVDGVARVPEGQHRLHRRASGAGQGRREHAGGRERRVDREAVARALDRLLRLQHEQPGGRRSGRRERPRASARP